MATNCENCGHRTNEVGGLHRLGRVAFNLSEAA